MAREFVGQEEGGRVQAKGGVGYEFRLVALAVRGMSSSSSRWPQDGLRARRVEGWGADWRWCAGMEYRGPRSELRYGARGERGSTATARAVRWELQLSDAKRGVRERRERLGKKREW